MMLHRKIFVITLLLFLGGGLFVQAQTRVSGQVIDEQGEPIPFANVIFKNTHIGTACDENGKFSLFSQKNYTTIEVSSVGFTTKEVKLKGHDTEKLKIVLAIEELEALVFVEKPKKNLSKKENPAYPILQKIWANKHKNILTQTKAYQYKRYETVELGLNNLDSVFLKKALQSEYKEIRNILSEKKYKQYFSMPMYLREEVSQVYGDNLRKLQRTDIEAERTQGVIQTGFGLERFTRNFREFDVYDNSFYLLDKTFVSPLSEYGYGVYAYVLNDTIRRDGRELYSIYFFPKQDQDLLFKGNFKVDSKTYAITSIQMYTIKEASLNFVRNLSVEKEYQWVNDSLLLPKRDYYEGDFTVLTKSEEEKGMYVKKNVTYSDYLLNAPKEEAFYLATIEKYKTNQFFQPQTYWNKMSDGDSLMTKTQNLIRRVGDNRRIKGISDALNIVTSGYIPIGKYVQFGSLWESFTNNDVEKNRFRFGLRSFVSNDDRFRTYLYGAYGTLDKKFKYGMSAKYLLFYKPRVVIGGLYQNDYSQLGSMLQKDDARLDLKNASNFLLARGENYYLTQNKRIQGVADIGLFKSNLHITLSGTYQQMKSADPDHFSIGYRSPEGGVFDKYSDANASLTLTYTPTRNVYGYGVEQFYGKNIFPTFRAKYTKGFSGIRNSQFDYSRLEGMIHYPQPLWSIGILHTVVEGGKVFGAVPLPLLTPTPANQTYATSQREFNRTFQLLDYYDFVTDAYINVYAEHHFNGFLLNRLPLIKKTKWRSLLLARMAYGTLRDENRVVSASNIYYNAPEKLYWEYGFGIENIGIGNFRPIRVDFIWRSSFNDRNGVKNPYFGIRFGIKPEF